MFPAHLRKSPQSLQELSENVFRKWLTTVIKGSSDRFWSDVSHNRVQIRRRLSAEVRTQFLASLVPSDPWKRPCLMSTDRVRCFQVKLWPNNCHLHLNPTLFIGVSKPRLWRPVGFFEWLQGVVYLCLKKTACIVFLLYLDDVTNAIWKKWGLVM